MSIEIRSDSLTAAFDDVTGAWRALSLAGEAASVLTAETPPFNLTVDGEPFFRRRRRAAEVAPYADGTGVVFTFEEDGLRIRHTVELASDLPVLRQSVEVTCVAGRAPRLLDEVVYTLPHLAPGAPDDCHMHLPGQRVPVGTPYAAMARTCRFELQPAPCHTSGVVTVENAAEERVVSAWLYSDQMVVFPVVTGDGEHISVEHRHQTSLWLRPGDAVTSEGYGVLLTTGPIDHHMRALCGAAYGGRLANVTDTPAWFADARVFQIAPYPIADWTRRLPEIQAMGFNVAYLCPVQAFTGSWYQIRDHDAIDARVGTVAELQDFVRQAHDLGMRVIFDYLPQGVGIDNDAFLAAHPDWLVRDALGRTHASHGWGPRAGAPFPENQVGTLSLDWGNPDYRRFAVDWALWYVETFDIDGFRCDALHWKEPNLALDNPRPAWATIYGGIRILEDLRAELKQLKPDAVLLSEVWGPIFQATTDGSYENGWILQDLNRSWLDVSQPPLFTAAQYRDYLVANEAARPQGYARANFTANHDMQPLAQLAHVSPLGNAVSFLHAFARGLPFVMWREPEGREAFFTAVMAQRAALAGYTCTYTEATTDADDLFVALWQHPDRPAVLAVASLALTPVTAEIRLPQPAAAPMLRLAGDGTAVAPTDGGIQVRLDAGGYALTELA